MVVLLLITKMVKNKKVLNSELSFNFKLSFFKMIKKKTKLKKFFQNKFRVPQNRFRVPQKFRVPQNKSGVY